MVLLRANSLAKGYSGIRARVIDQLCEMLNRRVTPFVPSQGSVTYTLIAPVRTNTSSGQVNNQVTVNGPAGSHSANDVDTLVIFRSSFEANGGLISAPAHPAGKTH